MLDTILGEKSFALNIAYVDTGLQPDEPEEEGMYGSFTWTFCGGASFSENRGWPY